MKKGKGNANASLEIALRTTREAFFDGYTLSGESDVPKYLAPKPRYQILRLIWADMA